MFMLEGISRLSNQMIPMKLLQQFYSIGLKNFLTKMLAINEKLLFVLLWFSSVKYHD